MQPQQPYSTPGHPSQYEFITNPQKPARGGLAAGPLKQRILIAGIGLLGLIIVATLLINLIKGDDKSLPSLITVAQQQQSIIHLTEGASTQVGISPSNSASAITTNLSVSTQQTELFAYFKTNKYKLSNKVLNAQVKLSTDTQLSNALQAGEYNTVFKSILQAKLASYKQALQQAYTNVKGPKGRAILTHDFEATKLLQKQLESE